MYLDATAVDLFLSLLAALGVLLNSYFVYRLNAKFDQKFNGMTGRVEEQGRALHAHVNAAGLHGR